MISLREYLTRSPGGAKGKDTEAEKPGAAAGFRQALLVTVEGLIEGAASTEADGEASARVRRMMEGALGAMDAMEVATEAVAIARRAAQKEQEKRRAEETRRKEGNWELTRALQLAMRSMMDGAGSGAKPAEMEALASRLEKTLEPLEAMEIATAALQLVKVESGQSRAANEQSHRWEDRAEAMAKGLRALLSAVAEQEADGEAMEELRGQLEGKGPATEVAEICERAASRVRNAAWRKHLSAEAGPGEGQEVTTALRQSLQLLIAGWRQPGLDAGREEARRRTSQELARRLEGTLSAFDVMEVASEARSLFEENAKAAADSLAADGKRESGSRADVTGEMLRAMRLMLEGLPMRKEDVEGPENQAIGKLMERLDAPLARMDALEIVNEALTAMDRHHKAGQDRHRRQVLEFQEMIAMLTQTVAALAVQGTASIAQLQEVEKQIEHASQVEDLRVLRSTLGECLLAVRECSNQQRRSGEVVQTFERHLQTVKERLKEPNEVAERAQTQEASDFYAVFVLDRERGIAARFGEDVRSVVLGYVHERLKEALAPGDRLVKWKGSAFLALLHRAAPLHEMCAELANVATIPTPPVIEAGNRSIRLPISVSWAVFPQSRYPTLETLFEKVDEFIAARRQ